MHAGQCADPPRRKPRRKPKPETSAGSENARDIRKTKKTYAGNHAGNHAGTTPEPRRKPRRNTRRKCPATRHPWALRKDRVTSESLMPGHESRVSHQSNLVYLNDLIQITRAFLFMITKIMNVPSDTMGCMASMARAAWASTGHALLMVDSV